MAEGSGKDARYTDKLKGLVELGNQEAGEVPFDGPGFLSEDSAQKARKGREIKREGNEENRGGSGEAGEGIDKKLRKVERVFTSDERRSQRERMRTELRGLGEEKWEQRM